MAAKHASPGTAWRNLLPAPSRWRKSSLSQGTANCVEVAPLADGGAVIRNSRFPQGDVLVFTGAEWDAFLDGAKKGEFDKL